MAEEMKAWPMPCPRNHRGIYACWESVPQPGVGLGLHGSVLVPSRCDKKCAGGSGTAGVGVGGPWLGVAVVQEDQVQFTLMDRELEEQRGPHPVG